MISAGYRWPLYDTSPTLIPLRRIDSEIIHFGRTNHQPDNAIPVATWTSSPTRPRWLRSSKRSAIRTEKHNGHRHPRRKPSTSVRGEPMPSLAELCGPRKGERRIDSLGAQPTRPLCNAPTSAHCAGSAEQWPSLAGRIGFSKSPTSGAFGGINL